MFALQSALCSEGTASLTLTMKLLTQHFPHIEFCRLMSYCPLMAVMANCKHMNAEQISLKDFFLFLLTRSFFQIALVCVQSNELDTACLGSQHHIFCSGPQRLLKPPGDDGAVVHASCPTLSRLSSACAATVANRQSRRCSVSLLHGGSKKMSS